MNGKSKVTLRMGGLYIMDGEQLRVIDMTEVRIIFIRIKDGAIIHETTESILERGAGELLEEVPEGPEPDIGSIAAAFFEEAVKRQRCFEQILSETYPAWEQIFQRTTKKDYMVRAAEELGCTEKSVREAMKKYLKHGRSLVGCVNGRALMQTGKLQRGQRSRAHKDADGKRSTIVYTEELEKHMRFALQLVKKGCSVEHAYNEMLDKYYTDVVISGGEIFRRLRERHECPSWKSVYGYVRKNLGGMTIREYRRGDMDVRNNSRPLMGSMSYGISGPGQVLMVDECELMVEILSESESGKRIGEGVLYLGFDPVTRIILAAHVGLKNNSYSGFADMLMTLLEPHQNQTRLVGVDVDDEVFPSLVIPSRIMCDQGAEYRSDALQRACRELGIEVELVPVGTGSAKGGVENAFMRIQHMMRNHFIDAGLVKGRTGSEIKKAKEKACMTLSDLRAYVYNSIILLNQTPLDDYSPSRAEMEAGIVYSPVELWRYACTRFGSPRNVTDQNRMRYLFALLPQDKKFKVDRSGICHIGSHLRYFVEEDWFLDMIKEKSPTVTIRYQPSDVGHVLVRYKRKLHVVPLAARREELADFQGMMWADFDDLNEQDRARRRKARWENRKNVIEANGKARRIVAAAVVLKGDEKADNKDVRKSRAIERRRLDSEPDEIGNRLIREMVSAVRENDGEADRDGGRLSVPEERIPAETVHTEAAVHDEGPGAAGTAASGISAAEKDPSQMTLDELKDSYMAIDVPPLEEKFGPLTNQEKIMMETLIYGSTYDPRWEDPLFRARVYEKHIRKRRGIKQERRQICSD